MFWCGRAKSDNVSLSSRQLSFIPFTMDSSLVYFSIATWSLVFICHFLVILCLIKLKYLKEGKMNWLEFNFYLWLFPINYFVAYRDLLPDISKNIDYNFQKAPNLIFTLYYSFDIFSMSLCLGVYELLLYVGRQVTIEDMAILVFLAIFVFALPLTIHDLQRVFNYERHHQDTTDNRISTLELNNSFDAIELVTSDVYQDFGSPATIVIISFVGQLVLYGYYCASVYFSIRGGQIQSDGLSLFNYMASAVVVGAYTLKDTQRDLEHRPSKFWRNAYVAAKQSLEIKEVKTTTSYSSRREIANFQRPISLQEWWIRRILSIIVNNYGNRLIVLMVAIHLSQIPLENLSEFAYNFAAAFAIREFDNLKVPKEYIIKLPRRQSTDSSDGDSSLGLLESEVYNV